MVSAGAAAGASADASEGSWPCPKCTFLNGADITLCTVCEQGRPYGTSGTGKGKGRAGLRPRSNLCPPRSTPSPRSPAISSFAESRMEEAVKEKDREVEPGSDLAMAMDSQTSKRPRRSARRIKRTRGLEMKVKEDDNPDASPTPGDETGGSVAATNTAVEAVTGAQGKPVELDDSDQGEGFGGEGVACTELSSEFTRDDSEEDWEEDDNEMLGETPTVFGRGWSAEDRRRAEERKKRARERDIAGTYGGVGGKGRKRRFGGSSTRPGPKPGRLSATYPGDDIFRARKYPVADDENPEDKPLVLNCRGGVTGGGARPFWRWPRRRRIKRERSTVIHRAEMAQKCVPLRIALAPATGDCRRVNHRSSRIRPKLNAGRKKAALEASKGQGHPTPGILLGRSTFLQRRRRSNFQSNKVKGRRGGELQRATEYVTTT